MSNNDPQDQDCAVCLQKCHHPTQLPCGHIFCFLCVKGVAIQSKRCAMCRAEIPPDYLDNPILLENSSLVNAEVVNEGYQWYYEGRNGWWKYDELSNIELENAYNVGNEECTLLLAGALYRINFQSMVQMRQSDRTRRRRVRRDTPTLPAKGIAGIKNVGNQIVEVKSDPVEINPIDLTSSNDQAVDLVEVLDSSDEESHGDNITVQENPIIDLVNRTSELNLLDGNSHDT